MILGEILAFEIRFWIRSWTLWIFLAIMALLFFGAASSDQIVIGDAVRNTYRNSPWLIETYYSLGSLLTLLMVTAFVNAAATRDFANHTDEIVFSTCMTKADYFVGRFAASSAIAVVPMAGVSAGLIAAKYMPWVEPDRWGPIIWAAHWKAVLAFALPNTLFVAAIVFVIAILTRSTVTSFLGSLVLIAAWGTSIALVSKLQNEHIAALVDPFGISAFQLATKYWTVADKNGLSIGYSGVLLENRALWMAVSAAILLFGFTRFGFEERQRSGTGADEEQPVSFELPAGSVTTAFGPRAQLIQLLEASRNEFNRLIRTTSFIVIAAAGLLNCIPQLIFRATEGYGNASFPVTYKLIEIIIGSFYIFILAMVTYYAGVLVWEERDASVDEVLDASPGAIWPAYLAKLLALMLALSILMSMAMSCAIAVQFFHGYHRYQLTLYVESVLGGLVGFAFLSVFAFLIHVIAPNKALGYFGFIGFVILDAYIWRPLHVGTRMVQFGSLPLPLYSDFYGYEPYFAAWNWFAAYWTAFCVLLGVASVALWQRGRETGLRSRLRAARLRLRGPLLALGSAAAMTFLAVGAWVYYNTEILNTVRSQNDNDALRADYEKEYKKFEGLPQPRVTEITYAIDLYPESRNVTMRGEQTIVNRTDQPIRDIHFTVADNYDTDIDLPGAALSKDDVRLHYRIYTFAAPLGPGESRRMSFRVRSHNRGFENQLTQTALMPNGTFFNNWLAPQIGYQRRLELSDPNTRRRFRLAPTDLMPALERNCTVDCMNNYISNNSDWVNVTTVISTSADQTAIAPGSLEREWTANGRRYFEYKLDHASVNFYSFLSGKYELARTEWNGIKVEVYYLKEHRWNVPKMLNSIVKSLEYYTANFGPYPHKEARIIEFPRVAQFAQAFPGTMPYSESIGFIANLDHPDDIDFVFYAVAHEMAHQWWAHQVVGANMQGATILSETLAQYSALMVMEHEYGRNRMHKFLEYEMDKYLRARGKELLNERPLLRVESSQGYIHYNKGSVVMYYLKEMIGEAPIDRALRKVLSEYVYAPPPYPTSYALVDALSAETPARFQYLIQDLFYDITLFSNRALSASARKRPDGRYDVTVEVETHKFKADEKGNEREVPVDDWIEIGALANPAKGHAYGKVLYRQLVHMTTGKAKYTFVCTELPAKAGIDPLSLMIDRIPNDNLAAVSQSP